MATGTVLLPVGAAILPDGSTGNAAMGLQRVKSSAAAPGPFWLELVCNDTTQNMAMWSFRLPANYSSAPALKVQFRMASATTGNVVLAARAAKLTPGGGVQSSSKAFDAANTSSATAVPGTAGFVAEISLTLTSVDTWAAGDFVVLWLMRDASNASDTATGNLSIVAVSLEYTTV